MLFPRAAVITATVLLLFVNTTTSDNDNNTAALYQLPAIHSERLGASLCTTLRSIDTMYDYTNTRTRHSIIRYIEYMTNLLPKIEIKLIENILFRSSNNNTTSNIDLTLMNHTMLQEILSEYESIEGHVNVSKKLIDIIAAASTPLPPTTTPLPAAAAAAVLNDE